ncbi:GNAT family N-acetyltransferase [Streptomyces lonarensis]|uniref:GNAT family N-acetyltransferase n=1 Tax=Streptomyces lonarensis TaxID=700599 RepID=A0A7X6CXL8_9ACTN|nr:GNAT family N-acetyltransferase [Streptomyces lonarensis]NJQ04340.1 GNAT family N-acetyltransferase [Streptomyces lonarensis]
MSETSAYRGPSRRPWRATDRSGSGAGRLCRPSTAAAAAPPTAAPVAAPAGIVLRPAGPAELAAAGAMHDRCSEESLARRYHGPPGEASRYLPHLLGPHHGRSVAAWSADGRLVGLGHLLWDGDEAEVALLVEDAWQRRGVGTALLSELLALAALSGRRTVYAVTRPSDTAMVRTMRGTGLPLEYDHSDGALVVSARTARNAVPVTSPPRR